MLYVNTYILHFSFYNIGFSPLFFPYNQYFFSYLLLISKIYVVNIYIHKRKRNFLEKMISSVTFIFKEKRGRPWKHFQNVFIFIIMLILIFMINIQIVIIFIFIYLEKYCGKIELIWIKGFYYISVKTSL